jgi:hypothetical protein
MLQWLNNNNNKNFYGITTTPLKPKLRNLNGKGNWVIQLFKKLYKKTKMPLELNEIKY